MHDREIVAAIVAGDPAGLAEAYDRYAPALHAYCRSLLAEPADAADAVQDTFVVAASKLDGLREPDRLRPWLYAVARNECHRRLRARARIAELDEAGEMTDASPEVGAAAERGELRRLVRAAIAGLNPGEREVIDLSLHELEGSDLASALGVPVNQAHALASRARAQLEKSLGVLLVARSGREACPELETMLASWDGQLTVLLRKRVSRHIEQCDVCGERKRRELSPAMLLSALPVIILPPGLRQQVLGLVADATPEAARYRDLVAQRAGPFTASGFPVPVHRIGRTRTPGRRTILFTAAALLLIVAGGMAAVALRHGGGGAPANAAAHSAARTGASTSPAGPSPPPTGSGRSLADRRAASAGSSPVATPNPVGTPSATTTTTPPSAPTPTATVSATPSPAPVPGTLEESPATITLTQSPLGPATATFTLTANGGPVTFTITVPPSAADGLSVSPSTGSLKAGQSATVTVTAIGNGPPTFTTELTLSPGGGTVTVRYPPRG